MGKSSIRKKIHIAACNYHRYLAGKTFLYSYNNQFVEIVFKKSSFLHLTGVNTNLNAKEFYSHSRSKEGLKVQEISFDKAHPYDLAERKTEYLDKLHKITSSEVLIASDVKTLTATYKIGITDFQIALLCGPNKDKFNNMIDECLVPYSFRVENIKNNKLDNLYEVDYILARNTNESLYSEITYRNNIDVITVPDKIKIKMARGLLR